jgi:hypothetical protein
LEYKETKYIFAPQFKKLISAFCSLDKPFLKIYCGVVLPNVEVRWAHTLPSLEGRPFNKLIIKKENVLKNILRGGTSKCGSMLGSYPSKLGRASVQQIDY